MKKSILIVAASIGCLVMTSCQKKFKKGEGGLEYKYEKEGSGEKAKEGDVIAFNFSVNTDRDSMLMNTWDAGGMPQLQPVMPDSLLQNSYKGDPNTIMRMLGEGDSVVFRINMDTMAAHTGQPKPEFANKYLEYTIKVEKLFRKGNLTDSVLHSQVDTYFKGELEKMKNSETSKLDNYIKSNKLEPKKTASGLQYVIEKEGKGNKPALGDTVVLNYSGGLTSGKIFDTSNSDIAKKNKIHNTMRTYEPIKISVGNDPVIAGWTEGLQLLSKGAKAKLLIPSSLGYGDRGSMGVIPPFAPLVFDIEIMDIIPGGKSDTTANPAASKLQN